MTETTATTETYRLAVRAETTKLATLRLPVAAAVATVVLTVGLSWLVTVLTDAALDAGRPQDVGGLEPATAFLVVLHYGQIGVIALAAWSVFQESDNGAVRTTFLAMPQRIAVLLAKLTVVLVAGLGLGAVSAAGSWLARCPTTCAPGFAGSAAADVQVLVGVAVYWGLLAVLTTAVSAVVRNGLVGMAVMLALVLAGSSYLLTLTPAAELLPDQAGSRLYQLPPVPPDALGPAGGLAVLLVWVLVATVGGALSFRRWST
ncbi:hypothetical protein V5D56_06570 [Cellulosimicrobium sp. PMB13]|uniref:hypothetical protein n=1 Tax=Cellulosimicrobium sp. PMB13 TaxID=3120158 RepID=UPI003F4C0CA2